MTSSRRSRRCLPLWCAAVMAMASTLRADDPADPVAGRDHWAFQPLNQTPPAVHSNWSRSPIDDFVVSRLQSVGLEPGPDAEPRDLIRRVAFHLIGLPPTPEEVRAFLEDRRPDALAHVVDRLLDSPRFGERWGRHWLDLARYADSNGLDENFLFREAWRYRNWVISAVNEDLPFDRFVLEQIAGDLLPYQSVDQRDRQRIASGFLVVGPKVLLGNDAKNQRMEVADEQIDTIGRTFLGLTVGCARCHDHKFEPIPTADYYALAGIFTSTEVMETRHMLNEQRSMERLAGLGPDGEALDAAYEKYWRELPETKEAVEHAKAVLDLLTDANAEGLDALAAKHADAVAPEAVDAATPREERIAAQKAKLAELEARIAHPPAIPPRAMIPADVETPGDECIRQAGQFDRMGEKVPRGFLQVLGKQPGSSAAQIPEGRSGRLELGRWLTDLEQGAGQLTARVLANRIWYHLMGEGLVKTVDNFGRTGEIPSHPELLDYLAQELIDSGWSIKALARQIVSSRTFAMSSAFDAAAHDVDPENRLLWRAHRRRLDPEALRDAMLAVSGQLDLAPMDSTVWYLGDQATAVGKNEVRRRTDFPCRSVYLPVIRNDLPELFEAFDFANPHATTGARPRTNTATQGLFMLNDTMVMDAAEAAARRLLAVHGSGSNEARLDRLFQRAVSGSPTGEEKRKLLAFIEGMESSFKSESEGDSDASLRAWTMACHAVFSLSRFQFLE